MISTKKMYSILALASVTRFGNLPEEILHHIISFNEIEAVEIIQKKMIEMLKNKIRTFQNLSSSLFRGGMRNTRIFYNDRIVQNEEIFKVLSLCDCCARHKNDRPKTLVHWVDTPFHTTRQWRCLCHCRQLSRMICRAII